MIGPLGMLKIALIAIAAMMIIVESAFAQTRITWTVEPTYETDTHAQPMPLVVTRAGRPATLYDDSYAALIVEEKYTKGWSSVETEGKRSAELLRKSLEARGYHVLIWKNLNGTDLRTVLDELTATVWSYR